MTLYDAIISQVYRCDKIVNYRGGIIVKDVRELVVVRDIFKILEYAFCGDLKISCYGKCILNVNTGSEIRIVHVHSQSDFLGKRFWDVVVSDVLPEDVVRENVRPNLKMNEWYISNNLQQIIYCNISNEDVKEFEKMSLCGAKTNNVIIDDIFEYNQEIFNKEYKCIWNGGIGKMNNSRIMTEITTNGKKYISYRAIGMSKKDITYDTEFINRTGEMYVNIKGEYKNDVYDINETLDVHYKVDTDVYDAFKVVINHGFVTLILFEKKNEMPALKDLSKREKPAKEIENNTVEETAE